MMRGSEEWPRRAGLARDVVRVLQDAIPAEQPAFPNYRIMTALAAAPTLAATLARRSSLNTVTASDR